MSFRYGALCTLLLVIVIFLALKSYETWTSPVEVAMSREEVRKPDSPGENPSVPETPKDPATIKSYVTIAEKNIFNPERKDFPVPISPPAIPAAARPAVRPQVILYGVTLTRDFQSASIANPGRPMRKGERETYTIKLGEKIGEYKLTTISPDRITLETEGDRFDVLLYEPGKSKTRTYVKTEAKPPTVTSTTAPPTPAPPPGIVPVPPPTPAPPAGTGQERITPPPPVAQPEPPQRTSPPIRRGRTPFYPAPRVSPQGGPIPGMPAVPGQMPEPPTPENPTREDGGN